MKVFSDAKLTTALLDRLTYQPPYHNPDVCAQNERLIRAGKTKMQVLGAAMKKQIL